MAMLKDSIITGDLRVTGTIYGNANLGTLNASGTGIGTNGQILTSTGIGLAWSNNVAPASHAHGNITNEGKIGTNANKAIYTGTGGLLQAGTLPVAGGGTGLTTSTYKNAVLIGNASTATNAFQTVRTGSGAFYATAQDGAPSFGTLPIAQGGTGKTSAADAWTALGGGASGKHADSYFAKASHGNHVPATQTANNAVFLRNDNTWQTVTPANIGAATSGHNHDTTYLKLSGGTLTGSVYLKVNTIDAKLSNNNVSADTYPTTFSLHDKNDNILVRNEAVVSANGNIAGYWYVRNYNTSGTQVAQKGIKMTMNKSGNLTYDVSDSSNFRTAIGVVPSVTNEVLTIVS